MIPFDIEDIQIRSRLLEGDAIASHRKETLVLAMTYQREAIRNFEAELKKFQPSVPAFSVEALNLASLRHALSENGLFGILEMGHSKSQLLVLQKNGNIVGVRSFLWGGKNLKDGADLDRAAIALFLAELRRTIKGMQTERIIFPKPFPLYTFGAPAAKAGFLEFIEENIGEISLAMKPLRSDLYSSRQIVGLDQLEDPEAALVPLSVALSQIRPHRAKMITFSESSFQFQQNLKKLKTGSFSLMRKVALLMIAPFLYMVLHFIIQTKENNVLMADLNQILKSSGLPISVQGSTEQTVDLLRKEIMENRKKLERLHEDDQSPLNVLSEFSELLPNHLKIDVREFKVTSSAIFISAETSSAEMADQIVEVLKSKYSKLKAGTVTNCQNKPDCKVFTVEVERQAT